VVRNRRKTMKVNHYRHKGTSQSFMAKRVREDSIKRKGIRSLKSTAMRSKLKMKRNVVGVVRDISPKTATGGCFNCGKVGHRVNECPNKRITTTTDKGKNVVQGRVYAITSEHVQDARVVTGNSNAES
jgi:hypothetical protein